MPPGVEVRVAELHAVFDPERVITVVLDCVKELVVVFEISGVLVTVKVNLLGVTEILGEALCDLCVVAVLDGAGLVVPVADLAALAVIVGVDV